MLQRRVPEQKQREKPNCCSWTALSSTRSVRPRQRLNERMIFRKIVLGAGLEPASLSAYAPQTYVSASSTTRASRGSKLSADSNRWQVSFPFMHARAHVRNRGLETNRISYRMKYQRFAIKLR